VTSMHFIGLDIHKKTISYWVNNVSATVLSEDTVAATRAQLDDWVRGHQLRGPWPWKQPFFPDRSMTIFCLMLQP
jgi:transposase